MRLIIKSPEYYGVAPNYINKEITDENEEERILSIVKKFDERAQIVLKDKSGKEIAVSTIKERYEQLMKRKKLQGNVR